MSKIFKSLVLCSALLLCAAMAFAASQNAVVYGTVYDASAKPLAGVKVTLENPAIAFSRAATTASDGTYTFSEVPPASGYKVTALQDGKTIDIRGGITVNVGEESVIVPALKAQATPKAVETSAKEMAVTTEKVATAQSGVITGDQLRSLPLYNRNFLTLGTLTPHTHDSGAADPLGQASFSVAGNRSTGNAFVLDGADNRASSSNQAVPFQVNDAIQEFSVVSSAGTAEYGNGNGGTVNVVTKRGGNNWHGAAFGYFGADQLNGDSPLSVYNGGTFDQAAARAGSTTSPALTIYPQFYNDYVATAAFTGYCTDGTAATCNTLFDPAAIRASNDQFKAPWQSQQFGANIGGPILKNRLFMFAGYEGTHIDNPNPIFERVPSTFDKTYDPYGTGTFGFGPSDLNYTLGQNILGLFPAANVIAVPNALEFFQGEAANHTMVHNLLGRADWIHSQNDTWGVRWVGQWLDQLHDNTLPASGAYPGNGSDRNALNQNLNMTYTHIFSSSLLNEAHAGFNRFNLKERPQDRNFDATTLGFVNPQMMTFALAGIDPQYSGAVPFVNGAIAGWEDWFWNGSSSPMAAPGLDGLFPMARIGAPLYAPSVHEDWSWFAADSVSWTKGRHQFKFGGEYRHFLNNVQDGGLNRGLVYSGNIGQFTSASEDCNESCGVAFGFPSFDYAQKNFKPWDIDLHSHAVALFAEDTFHAHQRLTVTLGVRWEYYSRPLEQHNNLWNFDPTANGLVQQGGTAVVDQLGNACTGLGSSAIYPFDPGLSSTNGWDCQAHGDPGLSATNWTNFMPRVGMAWDIFGDGNTVARVGAGMFYDREPTSYTSQLMYNRPTTPFVPGTGATQLPQAIYGDTFNGAGSFGAWGTSTLDPAVMVTQSVLGIPGQFYQSAVQPGAMYARDRFEDGQPRTWQINASIQHQFSSKLVAEAGYVGTYGDNLPVFFNQGFNNEWFCNSSGAFSGACDNNSFAPVFMQTNQGTSHYNSAFLRVRAADWHGLRVNGTYTFSHAHDNASALVFPSLPLTLFGFGCGAQIFVSDNPVSCGADVLGVGGAPAFGGAVSALTTTGQGGVITTPYNIPQDPNNFLRNDWGPSDYNTNHRFVMDWTWDVPSLQKKWGWSKWLDYWQISGIAMAQSGQPYTIYSLVGGELSQRANATGAVTTSTDPNNAISVTNLDTAFNTCGPALPSNGVFFASDGSTGMSCNGNTSRNQFTGPMFSTINLGVQKNFPIGGEGKMLSIRSEFYNLFGAENFYNPISLLSTDGVSVNPDFGKIKSAHDPRQIQFAVRYSW
ncbi:MAG: carboxypeptidase regulatory-like domain-containing protein [Acidobacteriota bacterium]|nr:carboxypeptidase regulatory-like domain-containing protein [Acidobacteriota bacterium]